MQINSGNDSLRVLPVHFTVNHLTGFYGSILPFKSLSFFTVIKIYKLQQPK